MVESNITSINLHRFVSEIFDSETLTPEFVGYPDGETGIFTIGGLYTIQFLGLSISVQLDYTGEEKPILAMRYRASLVSGDAWPERGEGWDVMIPYGMWYYEGRDDLGTEYEYWGGVSGYEADRTIFDSQIEFLPAVPMNASWVEIRFMDRSELTRPVHTFRADVPSLAELMAE